MPPLWVDGMSQLMQENVTYDTLWQEGVVIRPDLQKDSLLIDGVGTFSGRIHVHPLHPSECLGGQIRLEALVYPLQIGIVHGHSFHVRVPALHRHHIKWVVSFSSTAMNTMSKPSDDLFQHVMDVLGGPVCADFRRERQVVGCIVVGSAALLGPEGDGHEAADVDAVLLSEAPVTGGADALQILTDTAPHFLGRCIAGERTDSDPPAVSGDG
jgi:hypothetical protein